MKAACKLIVIGGSAGSLQVIFRIFKNIEPGIEIPFLLVLHRSVNYDSALEQLLSFKTNIPVKEIEEKELIQPGRIYVSPADYHVLIENDHTFSLDYSEKINFSRPSIDVVFKSAADIFEKELLCILLSGANADGADGLRYAKEKGSLIIVQDPTEAEVSYMPEYALELTTADHILKSNEIGAFINSLL